MIAGSPDYTISRDEFRSFTFLRKDFPRISSFYPYCLNLPSRFDHTWSLTSCTDVVALHFLIFYYLHDNFIGALGWFLLALIFGKGSFFEAFMDHVLKIVRYYHLFFVTVVALKLIARLIISLLSVFILDFELHLVSVSLLSCHALKVEVSNENGVIFEFLT